MSNSGHSRYTRDMIPYDPLEEAERSVREAHEVTRRNMRFLERRYPLFTLLLLTLSVAALFHGLDGLFEQFEYLEESPLLLVVCGIIGLFVTGQLYKRLGKDKYD
jgi:hypothetical protein